MGGSSAPPPSKPKRHVQALAFYGEGLYVREHPNAISEDYLMNTVEAVARAVQTYLLFLSVVTLAFAMYVGPVINRLRFTGAHIYYSYCLVFLLSLVQVKQCLELLIMPVNAQWWVPFVCKHISLLVYIAILNCIRKCKAAETGRCALLAL